MASLAKQLKKLRNELNKYASGENKYTYDDTGGLKKAYKAAKLKYDDLWKNIDNYLNPYQSDVDELYEKVMNPEKFTYDTRKDQLFQMYKQQYDKQGRRAMDNAMAIGAARNGGNLSSISQQSAQSQYLNYMDALNEKAADTYANALSRYQQKQSDLLNRYNVANDMNNAANDAYWQRLGAASTAYSNAQSAYISDDERQYRGWNDTRTFTQTQARDLMEQINAQQQLKYQKQQLKYQKLAYTGGKKK